MAITLGVRMYIVMRVLSRTEAKLQYSSIFSDYYVKFAASTPQPEQ